MFLILIQSIMPLGFINLQTEHSQDSSHNLAVLKKIRAETNLILIKKAKNNIRKVVFITELLKKI